jgi:hypothetical protein
MEVTERNNNNISIIMNMSEKQQVQIDDERNDVDSLTTLVLVPLIEKHLCNGIARTHQRSGSQRLS